MSAQGLGTRDAQLLRERIDGPVNNAVSQPGALDMGSWHSCNTTHCRAGWAVHLAGPEGYALEEFFNTELTAMLIYKASGYAINPDRFHDNGSVAMDDMRKLAEQ